MTSVIIMQEHASHLQNVPSTIPTGSWTLLDFHMDSAAIESATRPVYSTMVNQSTMQQYGQFHCKISSRI